MTQLVEGGDQTSSLLTGLSEGQLYTIRVFAYKDLPSLLFDPVLVKINGNIHYAVLNVSIIIIFALVLQFLIQCLVLKHHRFLHVQNFQFPGNCHCP